MSLSTLNSPTLIATLGSSAALALPALERLVESGALDWNGVRAMNVAAYLLNVYSTSRPGRIDGQEQESFNKKTGGSKEMDDFSPDSGKSLVTPSGWAFAIWGPIFLGEAAFVASQFLIPETAPVASIIKEMSAPFAMAQVFQSLWCASFRPKYTGRLMFISSGCLGGIAYSLSKAHGAFALSSVAYSPFEYCLYFLPITMHFGWTTAATLVNLNGAHAKQETISAKTVAVLGHASALAATGLGIFVTVTRGAPVYGGVISWALFAVADGMKTRIRQAEKRDDDSGKTGVYGAKLQKTLCTAGAWGCLGTSALTAVLMAS